MTTSNIFFSFKALLEVHEFDTNKDLCACEWRQMRTGWKCIKPICYHEENNSNGSCKNPTRCRTRIPKSKKPRCNEWSGQAVYNLLNLRTVQRTVKKAVKTSVCFTFGYLLEMSLSWNFPARASPSYEGFEPSRAGALQFSSWNRAEIFLSPN
jgi:hypothetical protein